MTLALAFLFLFVGAFFGVLAMALAAAAKDSEDREAAYWRGFREGAMPSHRDTT